MNKESKSKSQDLESKNQNCTKICKSSSSSLLLLLTVLELTSVVAGDLSSSPICTTSEERNVWSLYDSLSCTTRDVLVDLNIYVADHPDVLRIIPDKATVFQCGGVSESKSKPCSPTSKRMKRIPVVMIMADNVKRCSHVEVEEDAGCERRCPIQTGIQMSIFFNFFLFHLRQNLQFTIKHLHVIFFNFF